MITTGVTGRPWRASITEWGTIEPWDDVPTLDWFVAADDRWHVPAEETSVRQRRVEGTAVTETRVRVPSGDVVQRIYSVADAGGLTVVEFENESPMAVAVAFDRSDVLTERPIVDVPIEGIELPEGAFVIPLGHQATARIALAHGGQRSGPIPAGVSTMTQVVRGWLSLTERASRFVLPDGDRGSLLAEEITAQRCEIALGSIPRAADDAAGFVLALGELVRMGEPPDPWMPELVDAVQALGPVAGWDADAALAAAGRVLTVAGERRARRDLERIVARRSPSAPPADPPGGVRSIAWLESHLARAGALLPVGMPGDWLGRSVDVYGVPTVAGSAVSFAIRWHGERPALLWEQTGDAIELSAPIAAPEWSSSETKGETLWPPPPGAQPIVSDVAGDATPAPVVEPSEPDVEIDLDGEPGSFS
ncbi:MAG: hypothetical protein R8G01_09945 [Ilumatobacteraceae bacterium]|nr:hypothetical protein [Ilumatobacteraceae bacterium]